ncbi:hypothetical protein [Enhygromyxa salina]|uniref:hypothetical protein n=1 Tax=Enhygromyxa salina TaxID=215803 RepID=UPI0011B27AF4|nr:hypothetical protein [Enhygromyxa salina]
MSARLHPLILTASILTASSLACTPAERPTARAASVDPAPLSLDCGPSTDCGRPLDCGPPIDGAGALTEAGALVLFGEIHGTHEVAEFVGGFVCQGLEMGLEVHLGLELPAAQADAVQSYLASEGLESDRAALLAGAHWQREDQDGRSSEAVAGLIERARQWRAAGRPIAVFTFDVDGEHEWNERDAAMATRILAETEAHPDALTVTLSGNLHNRTVQGLPWDPEARPMGGSIHAARPDASSLDLRHHGGSAWICMSDGCGPTELSGASEGPSWAIERWPDADEFGYDGVFWVDTISAAAPAKTSAE